MSAKEGLFFHNRFILFPVCSFIEGFVYPGIKRSPLEAEDSEVGCRIFGRGEGLSQFIHHRALIREKRMRIAIQRYRRTAGEWSYLNGVPKPNN